MQKIGLTMSCWMLLVNDLLHELAGAPAVLPLDVQPVEDGARLVDRHRRIDPHAEALLDEVGHRDAWPGRGEVDILAADLDHEFAVQRVADGRDDHAFDEIHHVDVVREGLVGLEHRELGVVPHIDALVAKDAPDLEDALHPADDEPLQVQLQGDAQVHVDVERVVVADERSSRRAALNAAEHRAFDFPEAAVIEMASNSSDDSPPDLEDLAGAVVGHQVDIALPVAHFDVDESLVLVRRRP